MWVIVLGIKHEWMSWCLVLGMDVQEVIALLAFENPETCPSSQWLDIKMREEVAAALNAAILHQQGKRERSCLELAYRQLVCDC